MRRGQLGQPTLSGRAHSLPTLGRQLEVHTMGAAQPGKKHELRITRPLTLKKVGPDVLELTD